MKTFIITLVTALSITTYASAQDFQYKVSVCTQHGNLAETLMEARQAGLPISGLVDIPNMNQKTVDMIMDAYSVPRFSSQRGIADAIKDFRILEEYKCFQAFETQ